MEPSPTTAPEQRHFVSQCTLKGFFTPEECDGIIAMGEAMRPTPHVAHGKLLQQESGEMFKNRGVHVAWMPYDDDTDWIYRRMIDAFGQANDRFWKFRLSGSETVQFARYEVDDFHDWHMDMGTNDETTCRKLSMTVQLSDPADYEGGELIFSIGARANDYVVAKGRGTTVVFPSYMMHTVRPVTRGVRYSLVQWAIDDVPFT